MTSFSKVENTYIYKNGLGANAGSRQMSNHKSRVNGLLLQAPKLGFSCGIGYEAVGYEKLAVKSKRIKEILYSY